MDSIRIRCPRCDWDADGQPHWVCTCGHEWDTFSTGGRCPSCGKQWDDTQCVEKSIGGCQQFSPHLDWYENLDTVVDEIFEELKEKV